MKKQNASLETSFWTIGTRIGVIPYLFEFFEVYYCHPVEEEIVNTDPSATPLIYPQAMLFNVFKEDGRLYHAEPKKPLGLFGKGEAGTIALAYEQGWDLLINDYWPLVHAQGLGIRCISVPHFVVMLYEAKRISKKATLGYLNRLTPVTSPALLAEARAVVEKLAEQKGGEGR